MDSKTQKSFSSSSNSKKKYKCNYCQTIFEGPLKYANGSVKSKKFKPFCSEDCMKISQPPRCKERWLCVDCKMDTINVNYYMIKKELWHKYGAGKKMLCLKCLEKRMKRDLKFEDFIDCPVNRKNKFVRNLKNQINTVRKVSIRPNSF